MISAKNVFSIFFFSCRVHLTTRWRTDSLSNPNGFSASLLGTYLLWRKSAHGDSYMYSTYCYVQPVWKPLTASSDNLSGILLEWKPSTKEHWYLGSSYINCSCNNLLSLSMTMSYFLAPYLRFGPIFTKCSSCPVSDNSGLDKSKVRSFRCGALILPASLETGLGI